jgi:EmrB/QacA subfamily drug resistance transporter
MTQDTRYKWWVFGAVSVGLYMIVLDSSSINIALPTISRHFKADLPTVQWVVVGYHLAITALLLPVGRLADILGRKRVYLVGAILFALGAMVGSLAPNLPSVIVARVLQGAGSASIAVNTIAITLLVFPDKERGKAMGLSFLVLGLGAVSGPLVGGLLVSAFGWRSVFVVTMPVAVVAIVLALVVLDETRISGRHKVMAHSRFDWLGAVLSMAVLLLFLLGMSAGQKVGWGSPVVLSAFFGSAILMTAFVWWELRFSDPMLELHWFRRSAISLPVFIGFIGFLGAVSVMYLMPFYLQRVLEYSPREAGLVLTPYAVALGVIGPLSGRLSDRYGTRWLSGLGLVFLIIGLVLFARLTVSSSLTYVLLGVAITGFGMATLMPPNNSAVLGAVDRTYFGVANGMINLVRTGAWVIGIVLITTVVTEVMGFRGYEPSLESISSNSGDGVQRAFTEGLRYVYLGLIGLMTLGLIATVLRRPRVVSPKAVIRMSRK